MVLNLKSVQNYIIPIIAIKDKYHIPIQFDTIMNVIDTTNKQINIPVNEMMLISGVKIKTSYSNYRQKRRSSRMRRR